MAERQVLEMLPAKKQAELRSADGQECPSYKNPKIPPPKKLRANS